VAAFMLTYLVHSTIFIGAALLLARRLAGRPEWMSGVWKLALVGGALTATVQVGLGVVPVGGRVMLASAPIAVDAIEAREVVGDAREALAEPELAPLEVLPPDLDAGADLDKAAKLAGRTSGDSTVAYALAFARAVEAAVNIDAPPRAHYLRALMAELERLANHFGDIGAICNDASFSLMHAHCSILRERVLRFADAAFGHRLMMDCVVPGGVAADMAPGSGEKLRALLDEIRQAFPRLIELYDNTASLQDRTVGTGILKHELARRFAPGGYVGRASGRSFDARKALPYPPYDTLRFDVPSREDGDVNARVWIRIEEVDQSLSLIDQMAQLMPGGAVKVDVPGVAGEGLTLIEGFRGDILAWVRLGEGGRVANCHLRDPSWFQWPLLEAVIEGNIVADFPLCNKSFNCSYSGHDL